MTRIAPGFRTRPTPRINSVSYGAVLGANERDLPQTLSPDQAETFVGYVQGGQGRAESSSGIKNIATKAGITGYTAGDWWYDDKFLVGYGTTIAVIDESDGTLTEVKTNFSQNVTDVVSIGNYAFVASGTNGDKLYRISKTLAYDAQTANFTVGKVVTGATSGATATILEDSDSGTTGTLTLGNISGVFQNDEIITDTVTGSATVNGTLGFTATEDTNSFPANTLFIKDSAGGASPGVRLFLGGADGDPKKCFFTGTDRGTNPVFGDTQSWTEVVVQYDAQSGNFTVGQVVTGSESGATGTIIADSDSGTTGSLKLNRVKGAFRDNEGITDPLGGSASVNGQPLDAPDSAGFVIVENDINVVTSRGDSFLIGSDVGRTPFEIGSIDLGGLYQMQISLGWQYKDHGMARGAVDTSQGTFYLSRGGLYRLKTVNNEELVSAPLGQDYFSDVTLDNAAIVHDTQNNLIIACYAKDSITNNEALFYNLETGGISIRKGWNLSRLMRSPTRVYGLSGINGKAYKLFEGFTDDGKAIPTEIVQEIQGVRNDRTSFLKEFLIQAELFEDEEITIHFDIEEPQGGFVEDAQVWKITGLASKDRLLSWGSAGFGSAGWNSGQGGINVSPQKYENDMDLEFIRCKVRITSNLKTPHTINFYQVTVKEGNPINLNNITQVS